MIQLKITKCSKSYSPLAEYHVFDDTTENFRELADAYAWLAEQYGKSKRGKMYVDSKSGDAIHCGYVIGFRSEDCDSKYLERHWIHFYSVATIDLDKVGAKL